MKDKKYYTEDIQINGRLCIAYDEAIHAVIIKEGEVIHDFFSANRKVYTLFKRIQSILKSKHYLTIEDGKGDLYSGEIKLKDDVVMQVTNEHQALTLDFYNRRGGKRELLFLMPLTLTVRTLFKNIEIPYRLINDPSYRFKHVFKFLDMIQILDYAQKTSQ